MSQPKKRSTILMADDDADDRLLTEEAFLTAQVDNEIRFVNDGEELMDYLYHRGKFQDVQNSPMPKLILLDLNMPKKDGREVLEEIKADAKLRQIPIVVLTTSSAAEDILQSYNLGAGGYITKPVEFDSLVDIVKTLNRYWLNTVELPRYEC